MAAMQDLRPCTSCRRHVATTTRTCPFCETDLPKARDRPWILGRLSRAAAFTSLTLGSGCWHEPASTGTTTPPPVVKQAAGAISGIVTQESGQPIAGVTVHATSRSTPDGPGFTAISGIDGRYMLENMPAGVYDLDYYIDDLHLQRGGIAVRGGVVERIDQRIVTVRPEHHIQAKPYGAPPARRRIV